MKDCRTIKQDRILYKNEFFFIIKYGFPVTLGHLLTISNEVRKDYFELTKEECESLSEVIEVAKDLIETDFKPDGYNVGMNCGEAAGQTVFYFHCNLIPRYKGDIENPRGGLRHCVNGKGYY